MSNKINNYTLSELKLYVRPGLVVTQCGCHKAISLDCDNPRACHCNGRLVGLDTLKRSSWGIALTMSLYCVTANIFSIRCAFMNYMLCL